MVQGFATLKRFCHPLYNSLMRYITVVSFLTPSEVNQQAALPFQNQYSSSPLSTSRILTHHSMSQYQIPDKMGELMCSEGCCAKPWIYLKGISAHANYITLKGELNAYNAYWYWRDLGALDKIYLPYSIIQNLTSPVSSMVILVLFIDDSMISKPCMHSSIRV